MRMNEPPSANGPVDRPANAYEAFWDSIDDAAPTAVPSDGDGRDAYRQFWELSDPD